MRFIWKWCVKYYLEDSILPMASESLAPYTTNRTMLVGCYKDEEHFEWIKQRRNVYISWLVFGVLFVLVYFYGDIAYREWLYGRVGYEEILEESFAYGILFRACMYIVMMINC